jgi:hypothetical protein
MSSLLDGKEGSMALQDERTPQLRRFLAINFLIGTDETGYLIGPTLVSTGDYRWFHFWDEASAAVLEEDDYEVVKVYRLGLGYDEVARQFAKDFPAIGTGPYRCAGWIGPDGAFISAEGWAAFGQHLVPAA